MMFSAYVILVFQRFDLFLVSFFLDFFAAFKNLTTNDGDWEAIQTPRFKTSQRYPSPNLS